MDSPGKCRPTYHCFDAGVSARSPARTRLVPRCHTNLGKPRVRVYDRSSQGAPASVWQRKAHVSTATEALIRNAVLHEADFEGPREVIPTEHVAIVTCMDSRIDIFRIFGLDSGQAHILRNAGGLATDDMLRSLVLSQRAMQTREIVLMHHTGCGLHGTDEAALNATLVEEVGHAPPYGFGAFDDIDRAVRDAVERVRAHPFLPHRDHVRGFIYETETGHVREVHV